MLVILLCMMALSQSSPAEPNRGWARHTVDDASRGADGVRLADVNGDGRPDIATGWEQGGLVRVYLHPGPAGVKQPWPAVTVGRVRNVEDAVCADLDGDGALDVVSCAEGQTRQLSCHWAPPEPGDYLREELWHTTAVTAAQDAMMWMFALPCQLDGLHGVDLVAGGKNRDAYVGWFEPPADARQMDEWRWHTLRRVGWLMSLVGSDMDADGDLDIVFSDRKRADSGAYWLENPGQGPQQAQPWREHVLGGVGREAKFLELIDLDRDGLEDVLLAIQPKEILWLRRLDASGRAWESNAIPLPEPTGDLKAVTAGDVDGDGRLDLVFSCEHAERPREGLMWLSSDGPPRAGAWTAHTLSGVDGIKHDLVALIDLDADGDLEALTTEEVENLGVIWYENPGHK